MILILDDDPERHRRFQRYLDDRTVCHVETARDAILAIKMHHPSVICLDHDLDQFGRSIAEAGTGQRVAEWLRRHPQPETRLVVVHSMNPMGAACMVDALNEGGYTVIPRPEAWRDYQFCRELAEISTD
jgi:CheY-like chemotaxis protein